VDPAARLPAADANLVAALDVLREHVADPRGGTRAFGGIRALATGIEVPFFNPILALTDDSRLEDIVAAVDWVRSSGIEPSIQVASHVDPRLRPGLLAARFQPGQFASPVMVLDPIPPAPPLPDGVGIRTGGAELYEDWHVALDSGPVWRGAATSGFLGDPRVRAVVAYLDGEPVAASSAIRLGSTLGIYAVGTREHARRRGIGRAATWAAIDVGRHDWDSEIAILQSSEMGVPVYRSMGFEQVGALVMYGARGPSAEAESPEVIPD